jgi:hypothetical protein
MDSALILLISSYLCLVDRACVSPQRTELHDSMMWEMRLNGIPFDDRDDARLLAFDIRESDYAVEWTILFWHNLLKSQTF